MRILIPEVRRHFDALDPRRQWSSFPNLGILNHGLCRSCRQDKYVTASYRCFWVGGGLDGKIEFVSQPLSESLVGRGISAVALHCGYMA